MTWPKAITVFRRRSVSVSASTSACAALHHQHHADPRPLKVLEHLRLRQPPLGGEPAKHRRQRPGAEVDLGPQPPGSTRAGFSVSPAPVDWASACTRPPDAASADRRRCRVGARQRPAKRPPAQRAPARPRSQPRALHHPGAPPIVAVGMHPVRAEAKRTSPSATPAGSAAPQVSSAPTAKPAEVEIARRVHPRIFCRHAARSNAQPNRRQPSAMPSTIGGGLAPPACTVGRSSSRKNNGLRALGRTRSFHATSPPGRCPMVVVPPVVDSRSFSLVCRRRRSAATTDGVVIARGLQIE